MTTIPQRAFRLILDYCDDRLENRQKIHHCLLLVEYTIVRDQSLHYIDLDDTPLYTGPNIVKSIRQDCTQDFLEAAAQLLLLEMYQQKILSHDWEYIDSIQQKILSHNLPYHGLPVDKEVLLNSTQPPTSFFKTIQQEAKSKLYPYFYTQTTKDLLDIINDDNVCLILSDY